MTTDTNLRVLLSDQSLSSSLRNTASRVLDGQRIGQEEGALLFREAPLSLLGALANFLREKKHGDNTWFNRNFHIEPTNVCVYDCKFCSYSRLIKKRSEGWEYSLDDIMDIVRKYDDQPVTEVHIVGGVLPQYDLDFYSGLFRKIKQHRPGLHIKALTPVEYHYIFKKAKISYAEGMQRMKEAGLDSMPGGGAEIFHPDIRKQIAADKCTAEQWLAVHEAWHQLGGRSNATILYGHIESYEHRIHHLELLRQLQDRTGGFQTFIPLKFRNQNNQLSHIPETSAIEDLRMYALSRIYLDNFDHLKAYWPMLGRHHAQLTLAFGVDDLDGTIDDTTRIYSMAGSEEQHPSMNTAQLVKLIREVGRRPVERDTLYQVIRDYTDVQFDEEESIQGYVPLPVLH